MRGERIGAVQPRQRCTKRRCSLAPDMPAGPCHIFMHTRSPRRSPERLARSRLATALPSPWQVGRPLSVACGQQGTGAVCPGGASKQAGPVARRGTGELRERRRPGRASRRGRGPRRPGPPLAAKLSPRGRRARGGRARRAGRRRVGGGARVRPAARHGALSGRRVRGRGAGRRVRPAAAAAGRGGVHVRGHALRGHLPAPGLRGRGSAGARPRLAAKCSARSSPPLRPRPCPPLCRGDRARARVRAELSPRRPRAPPAGQTRAEAPQERMAPPGARPP